MKRNKLFKCVYWMLGLMPLLLLGWLLLAPYLNIGVTQLDTSANMITRLETSIDDLLYRFGFSYQYDVSWETLTISQSLSNGMGFPFVKYFITIFNTSSLMLSDAPIYIFVNWYLNYLLLINLVVFIPYVLQAFINLAFNMIDWFTSKGEK